MSIEVMYARRPERTSQVDRPRSRVTEFGRWTRQSGAQRTIALLTRPGLQPAVAIAHWRDGLAAGLILIFADHEPVVRSAIEAARGASSRRFDAGAMQSAAGDHVLRVWSRDHTIGIGKTSSSGAHLGKATILDSAEIDALELALDALRQAAAR